MTAIEIAGAGVAALDGEAGGHRIQRVPPTEKRGRVHSSTVTVAVLDPAARTKASAFRESDVEVQWFSGTGCGGQHRNKHQNSARVLHVPTGLVRTAQTRSRQSSLQEAMAALRAAVEAGLDSEAASAVNGARRTQIGTGERSDKRRTWRFQEDRVVDHVTGRQARASDVMRGRFEGLWR